MSIEAPKSLETFNLPCLLRFPIKVNFTNSYYNCSKW
ncbi:hypothetical protein DFP98_101141 [Cohnella phaseoli]|uniref:Uncharacterized protein n=1 Tax=Cohnella phaseoli TaxID=456490 RepID=A0A3D9KR75_9BACL|nr:hypothetical protein DFP98_101141 [Cohnella phaseoli]